MKPNSIELKLLQKDDERLIRFKETNFIKNGHPDPDGMFLLVIIFSIPFLGQALLLLGLLFEWFYKLWRMLCIMVKAFYFYSTKIFMK